MSNKFKSIMGHFITKGLFYETTLPDTRSACLFTLKDQDHEGYVSLYRLYMEANDPTEYQFAVSHLDGWEHWEAITACSWFKPYLARWRKELELRMKSKALSRIMSEAKTTSKESFAANKYLLEKGWEPKNTHGRGRPSKEEIKEAARQEAQSAFRLEDDLQRIMPKDVN